MEKSGGYDPRIVNASDALAFELEASDVNEPLPLPQFDRRAAPRPRQNPAQPA